MKDVEWPEPDEGVQRALEHAKNDPTQMDIEQCIDVAEHDLDGKSNVNVDTPEARIRKAVRQRLKGKR